MLNFQGSKFSQMAVREDFVEIISRNRCLNTAHVMGMSEVYIYLICTVTLSSALELAAVSKAVPASKASLWRVSLVDLAA